MTPGQTLTNVRVLCPAAMFGHFNQTIQLRSITEVGRRGPKPTLVAQQRHGDGPTAIYLTYDVALRHPRVREKHFVEMTVARDVIAGPNLKSPVSVHRRLRRVHVLSVRRLLLPAHIIQALQPVHSAGLPLQMAGQDNLYRCFAVCSICFCYCCFFCF